MTNFKSKKSSSSFTVRGVTSKIENETNVPAVESRSQNFTNISTELARNSKYVVSRLTASPLLLNQPDVQSLYGSIDERLGYGILITEDVIHLWKFNSVDSIPTTTQLPVTPSNNGFLPLAILVSPIAGSSDPGLISINSHTGHIRFYESINTASSVGLLQKHKGIDYILQLYDREYITIAEAVEPAGILISTSQGRLLLLSFRDSAGNPYIKISEISKRQTGFFKSELDYYRQIVSIKPGAILGQGERVVATITSGGDFQVLSCSRDGQFKQIFKSELNNLLVDYIKELYPSSAQSLQVLDFELVPTHEREDVFLVLASFDGQYNETYYVLFTVKKESNHIYVFSAYRINTYTSSFGNKPKLYVPSSPEPTAFVVFDDAVVLTELVTKIDDTLKRKWEDVISFRSNTQIIGSGVQNSKVGDQTVSNSPSVFALIGGIGALQIEKLTGKTNETFTNPSFLKSHIEQAVFYGDDSQNPIEFDIPEHLTLDSSEIETELLQVAREIFNSSSIYLPPRLSSLQNHLLLRKQKLEKLLSYTAKNFKTAISSETILSLIELLEKISTAVNLHKAISKNEELNILLGKLVSAVDAFFLNGLDSVNEVLTDFIKKVLLSNNTNFLQNLTGVYSEILGLEKTYRYDLFELDSEAQSSTQKEIWFTLNDSYILLDEVFQKLSESFSSLSQSEESAIIFIELTEILFYFVQQKLAYLVNFKPKTREVLDSIGKVESFRDSRSGVWTKTLVSYGAKKEALAIAETYGDLKSLVEISDEDRENSADDIAEIERVGMRFDYYFNKFQYEFASTLYNYYIQNGKYRALLLGFKRYKDYLKLFFEENEQNYGKISWIKDIFDEDYKKSSKTLLKVSQNSDNTQSDRELQLSIAKLTALVSSEEDREETLQEIQEELDYVEAQGTIFDQISDFIRSDSDPIAQLSSIAKDLRKNIYDDSVFKVFNQSFERALSRLLTNKSLTVNELIDVFTLLDGKKTNTKLNYFYALKVLHLSNISISEKEFNAKLIWKRAILADDWTRIISDDKDKSDDYIKERIEGTVIYETLFHYFKHELFNVNNDFAVNLPEVKSLLYEHDTDTVLLNRFKFTNDVEKLKEEIHQENSLLLENYTVGEFDSWIKAIIGTANEKSKANRVINYSDLVVQNAS